MDPLDDYDSDEDSDLAELESQFEEWASDVDVDWETDWDDVDLDDLHWYDIDWDEVSEAFDHEDEFDWFSKLS